MTGAATIHQNQPVDVAGVPLEQAKAAMVMIHGRGATAASILTLADAFNAPDLAYLAPQAAGNAWYPQRFVEPVARNEPWLTSALDAVAQVVERIKAAGIPAERILLLGFSQGACLALEFAARNPRRYGGLLGLSGALIENGNQPRSYHGSLDGTPVFLGCSTTDFHIPKERVERSADVLRSLGADVTLTLYPNMEHTVIPDEIVYVQRIIDGVKRSGR